MDTASLIVATIITMLIALAFIVFSFVAMLQKIINISDDVEAMRYHQEQVASYVTHKACNTDLAIQDIAKSVLRLLPDENITQEMEETK